AEGRSSRAAEIAAEFVRLKVDVIVTYATPPALAAKQATSVIPIVFAAAGDPVSAGLVASLARPGGNVTGFIMFEYSLAGKWLQLPKQFAPSVTGAAVLRDPSFAAGVGQFAVIQSVAPSIGMEVSAINWRDPAEIERAIARFAGSPNGGLIVT